MEVSQKTFIAVYQNIRKLQDTSKFKTWLYRIAWNQCHEENRKISRKTWFSFFASREAHEVEEFHLTPDRGVQDGELNEIVGELLKSLPEEQRTILILKEYEGLKFKEIADLLGISENTAKSRLYYALKALRKLIEDYNIDINSFLNGK